MYACSVQREFIQYGEFIVHGLWVFCSLLRPIIKKNICNNSVGLYYNKDEKYFLRTVQFLDMALSPADGDHTIGGAGVDWEYKAQTHMVVSQNGGTPR